MLRSRFLYHLHFELNSFARWGRDVPPVSQILWKGDWAVPPIECLREDVVINRYYKAKKEIYATKVLEKAWLKCRYNPQYKMCETVQVRNLERDTGIILDK